VARAIGVGPGRIPAIEITAIEGEHPPSWVPGTGRRRVDGGGVVAIGVGPGRIPANEFTAIEGEHPPPWVPGTGRRRGDGAGRGRLELNWLVLAGLVEDLLVGEVFVAQEVVERARSEVDFQEGLPVARLGIGDLAPVAEGVDDFDVLGVGDVGMDFGIRRERFFHELLRIHRPCHGVEVVDGEVGAGQGVESCDDGTVVTARVEEADDLLGEGCEGVDGGLVRAFGGEFFSDVHG